MWQAKSLGRQRRDDDALIVDPQHCVERQAVVQLDEPGGGLLGMVEANDLGAISHDRLESGSPVGCDDQLYVQDLGGRHEIRGSIGGARDDENYSAHGSYDGANGGRSHPEAEEHAPERWTLISKSKNGC